MSAAQVSPYAFACIEGTLWIRMPYGEMKLQWSPHPEAQRRLPGVRTWQPFRPEFRVLFPSGPSHTAPAFVCDLLLGEASDEMQRKKAAAFEAFREHIPRDIAAAAEPFGSHQWALMTFMGSHPHAADLVRNNPVLGYALANHDHLRGTPTEAAPLQAVARCHARQRTILGWLGFPATEAVVRLMRKLRPEWVSPHWLRRLRTALLRDPELMTQLAHLPTLNGPVLDLVTNWSIRPLITPALLLETAQANGEPSWPSLGDRIQEAVAMIREMAPRRPLHPLRSIEAVLRLHEETLLEYHAWLAHRSRLRSRSGASQGQGERHPRPRAPNLRRPVPVRAGESRRSAAPAAAAGGPSDPFLSLRGLPPPPPRACRARALAAEGPLLPMTLPPAPRPPDFPPPPIPGTDSVIPLTSEAALAEEGRQQRNCVASYATRVRMGRTYIYRVLHPERATLSIVQGPRGVWRRSELKGRGNREVSPATVAHVDRWLFEAQRHP